MMCVNVYAYHDQTNSTVCICKCTILTRFVGGWGYYFFNFIFYLNFFALSWDSNDPNIKSFKYCPIIFKVLRLLLGSVHFFVQPFFSLFFRLDNIYIIKFTVTFLCHLHSTTKPTQYTFYYCIFQF